MIVDFVRSCYSTKMRFFQNNLAVETPVDWYFAPDGAQPLPFPTRFGSGNWASERWDWPGTGEVLGAARKWRNGSANPAYKGTFPCGTAEQFLDGSYYPAMPFVRTGDGVPVCCSGPRLRIALAGALNTPYCDELWHLGPFLPPTIGLNLAGLVDVPGCFDFSTLNGSYTLDYGSTHLFCFYEVVIGDPTFGTRIRFSFNFDGTTQIEIGAFPVGNYGGAIGPGRPPTLAGTYPMILGPGFACTGVPFSVPFVATVF